MADRLSLAVKENFERALEDILARVLVSACREDSAMAIAYSGGLDSSALLHLAADYARNRQIKLFAFHVHHGLSPNADAWLAHCEQECRRLNVGFDARKITVEKRSHSSLEEAARLARYAALGELCRAHGVRCLLTAHHQDDQAETVLLQLLRGSGVAGLAGMQQWNAAPDLLGDDVIVARPLLQVSRAQLAALAESDEISFIEDESNADLRYTRNALRHRVMPVLAQQFAGFQARMARTAQHAESAQRLLNELAAQDLATCTEENSIDLSGLRLLNSDRIDNALRYWFHQHRMRMPSTAWLAEMRSQLLAAKDDAQLCVTHRDCEIRRYRGRAYLCARTDRSPESVQSSPFVWSGEGSIPFPDFHGILHFDPTDYGISADWLRLQPLTLRHRHGGERLKLAENRSTRSLKHHYQALRIPAWERQYLPLVETRGQLVFAAGIGVDCRFVARSPHACLQLRWEVQHD